MRPFQRVKLGRKNQAVFWENVTDFFMRNEAKTALRRNIKFKLGNRDI